MSSYTPQFLLSAILLTSCVATGASTDDREKTDFFEKQVRPLLIDRCLKCHSTGSEDIGGNLLLDSRAGWMQGGDLGPAVKEGRPDESILIEAVRQSSDELKMPPDGKLSRHEVEILEKWVAMGAPDPRDGKVRPRQAIDLEQGRKFWAFQVYQTRQVRVPPEISGFDSFNELDRFLFQKQAKLQITAGTPASRRIMIRRVTLAMTGLLPTPEETEAFVNDPSPIAYQRVIDRLLASPAYGQTWGRYWLDVARYADSNGLDENIAHGNAWRYRDYVVRSFNHDKSFARFVQEQVAGDLLVDSKSSSATEKFDRLIATGFLSLGPKVLAEVDETKMEMDIVDEQVDTVGRAFMGLTLGCARCHDHKFDPIRTEDYYALAGIFKSTRTMEHFKKIARWHEITIASEEEIRKKNDLDAEIAKLKKTLKSLQDAAQTPQAVAKTDEKEQIQRLNQKIRTLESKKQELPTAMGVQDRPEPVNLPVHIRGSHLSLGKQVARGFPAVIGKSTTVDIQQSGRKELAEWLTDEHHPLVARVIVNRIWRWHFGEGIVKTTDNFGNLGERPFHPELLDWLAIRFVDEGWSIKSLHRLILMSATYQLASRTQLANQQVDPENRLLARANVRRMRAETIRDTLLQVAGMLDFKMGGSQLHVNNREFLFDHTSKDQTRYDARTRSIYLPVIRNNLYDFFQLFDYSDASVADSNRDSTTVPSQSLFLMNSPLVKQVSTAFAKKLLDTSRKDTERLDRGYLLAYSRYPSLAERERDLRFIQRLRQADQFSEVAAWQQLCQVILMSNEFVYIR